MRSASASVSNAEFVGSIAALACTRSLQSVVECPYQIPAFWNEDVHELSTKQQMLLVYIWGRIWFYIHRRTIIWLYRDLNSCLFFLLKHCVFPNIKSHQRFAYSFWYRPSFSLKYEIISYLPNCPTNEREITYILSLAFGDAQQGFNIVSGLVMANMIWCCIVNRPHVPYFPADSTLEE